MSNIISLRFSSKRRGTTRVTIIQKECDSSEYLNVFNFLRNANSMRYHHYSVLGVCFVLDLVTGIHFSDVLVQTESELY